MKAAICSLMMVAMVVSTGTGAAQAKGPRLSLDVSPANGVMKAGRKQSAWVRVGLNGFRLDDEQARPPVNLAIVLDRSGSMQGHKIEQARNAAVDAIGLLRPTDIVSVVTYNSTVSVVVPATRLTDPNFVVSRIRGIQPGGNTALFAGVSKGAAEVRKFQDREYVNRVILLSDGLANEGPSSPGELAALGASLLKENISVTTLGLGLGYNEDLMTQLALKSGGNHHFIEDATQLLAVFRSEFDDVLSVVAQEIDVTIRIPEGIRPVRVLGNEADINGQEIVTRIAQIYSEQERYVVLELEIPESEPDSRLELASVEVSCLNLKTKATERLEAATSISFSDSDDAVERGLNKEVMADVVALISSEQNKLATRYLDAGDLASCRATLAKNAAFLAEHAERYMSPELKFLEVQNRDQLERLTGVRSRNAPAANAARKGMRYYQNVVDLQQRSRVSAGSASSSEDPGQLVRPAPSPGTPPVKR